jgi:hypothetical protein
MWNEEWNSEAGIWNEIIWIWKSGRDIVISNLGIGNLATASPKVPFLDIQKGIS